MNESLLALVKESPYELSGGVPEVIGTLLAWAFVGIVLGVGVHFIFLRGRSIWPTIVVGAAGSALGRVIPVGREVIGMTIGAVVLLGIWTVVIRKRGSRSASAKETSP